MSVKRWMAVACFIITKSSFSQTVASTKIDGYFGIYHPIVTLTQQATTTNFTSYYQVGFPIGINIWKSAKIGFSFEFLPFVKSVASGSKMSNIVFHPGVCVPLNNGFSLTERLAFESSGRYGLTQVFVKTIAKRAGNVYYISVPLGFRFGNYEIPSVTTGVNFGILL